MPPSIALRIYRRPSRAPCFSPACLRPFSTSSSSRASPPLTLAYNLHEPPSQQGDSKPNAPIIFMHGLFGSKKNNRSISKALARDLKRPIYAIDLRNHGDSPQSPTHDYLSMAADVHHFIQSHSLSQPTLIGHSMGAKTAMTLALLHPSLISSLVSIDNAPLDAALKSDFGKYTRGMLAVEAAHVTRQSEADAILKEYEESLPIRQFLLTNLYRAPEGDEAGAGGGVSKYLTFRIPIETLARSLDKMADFPFKNPEERRYEGPTLFVRGTKSKYVADEALPVIGRFFPRFRVVDIEAGHWVVSEKPEEFRRAVVEFLQQPSD